MAILIPCSSDGQSTWRQRTALDGRDYILSFDWVQRLGHWLFAISDQDGSPIVSGIVLVTNWPLLRGVTDARIPRGHLVLDDTTGRNEDPDFSGLGVRFKLLYFSSAELA